MGEKDYSSKYVRKEETHTYKHTNKCEHRQLAVPSSLTPSSTGPFCIMSPSLYTPHILTGFHLYKKSSGRNQKFVHLPRAVTL